MRWDSKAFFFPHRGPFTENRDMCGAKADLGILSMQVHQSSIERGMIAVYMVSFTHSPINPGPPLGECWADVAAPGPVALPIGQLVNSHIVDVAPRLKRMHVIDQ